jgi:TatD DNase family protein
MKFINLHTHRPADDGSIQIINLLAQSDFPGATGLNYSIGLHPWHIGQFDYLLLIEKMKELAKHQNVLAIGECGLDRSIDTPLDLQEQVFILQVEIAEKLDKPLIIHAVKTYTDLIMIKKTRKQAVPWILHGYNGNLQTTKQLLNHDFYFSFGPQILKNQERQIRSLKEIPDEKLFFETDDSRETIETIYTFAAQTLGLSVNEMQAMIFENYKRIFQNG